MNDRFVRGYVAGMLGGIVMALISQTAFWLGLVTSRIFERAGIIFLGYVPDSLGGQLVCLIIQLGHAAVTGILFAYLVPAIGSRYLAFKGATIGVITWFIIFSVGSLAKLPEFYNLPWYTVATNLFTASMWGLTASRVLVWLEERAGKTAECSGISILASPAYKRHSGGSEERSEEPPARGKEARRRSLWPRLKFW